MLSTGESAVFLNLNTSLLTFIDSKESIYPQNWELRLDTVLAISEYCEKYEIGNIFIIGNVNYKYTNSIINVEKYQLFVTDVCSQVQTFINNSNVNKNKVLVRAHTASKANTGWYLPSNALALYLAEAYKIDLVNSTMIVGDADDEQFAKNSNIKIRYTLTELHNGMLVGNFAKN